MNRHSFPAILLLPVALLITPTADAAKRKKTSPVTVPDTVGPTVSPPSNVFLRNSFDTDPSRYLGRFVDDGVTLLDESNSAKTRCSQFVSWTRIGGGNVVHDELFQVSDSASASFGFPPFLSMSGGGGATKMVRIKYTSVAKMVSDIEDPAGFEACCKEAPDQCSDRYIGEFIEGSGGEVLYAVGNAADFQASGMYANMLGQVDIKHGMAWQRGVVFDEPVYFAFKTMNSGFGGGGVVAEAGCGSWVDSPPRSSQGQYFVGVSEYLDSERMSREGAMLDARTQTVKWLGESITTGSAELFGYQGSAGDLQTQLLQAGFVKTAADGVASLVKDENWCMEQQATPAGVKVKTKVLAFLPKASYAEAAEVLGVAGSGD